MAHVYLVKKTKMVNIAWRFWDNLDVYSGCHIDLLGPVIVHCQLMLRAEPNLGGRRASRRVAAALHYRSHISRKS